MLIIYNSIHYFYCFNFIYDIYSENYSYITYKKWGITNCSTGCKRFAFSNSVVYALGENSFDLSAL